MAFPLTGLVSYWKLDEASGTRMDSHGTNHLTPTNAPVGATGKIGNGCDFESSSLQYLSHADPNPLGDEDFTYALWFKRESVGVFARLISKVTQLTVRAYTFQIADWGGIHFVIGDDAKVIVGPVVNDTTWHFALAWHDAGGDTLNLQLDNGAVATIATAGIFPPPSVLPDVTIGGVLQWPGAEHYFDGLIDEVGLWRRVLTAQERTDLYNGGAGLTLPPLSERFPVGSYPQRVIADGASNYWRLGEPSGTTAVDIIGGANGTISGGVTLGAVGAIADGNTAMTFDGATGKIVTVATVILPAAAVTIEGLVKLAPNTGQRPVFFSGNISLGGVYAGATYSGPAPAGIKLFLYSGNSVIGDFNLDDNQWHHVAYVIDGTTAIFYQDGVATTRTITRSAASTATASIGYRATTEFWPGALDDIAIYPRALTAPEIAAHYTLGIATGMAGLPGFIIREDDMVRYNVTGLLTPSDTVNLGRPTDAIWVGGAGNVTVVGGDGRQTLIKGVPAGTMLPIAALRVMATGTTATDLVAFYAS